MLARDAKAYFNLAYRKKRLETPGLSMINLSILKGFIKY